MSSEDTKLVALPLNGQAPNNDAIAAHLREQAEWMEEQGAPGVRTVILVIEYTDGELRRQSCGAPTDLARNVGLLTIAATRLAVGE